MENQNNQNLEWENPVDTNNMDSNQQNDSDQTHPLFWDNPNDEESNEPISWGEETPLGETEPPSQQPLDAPQENLLFDLPSVNYSFLGSTLKLKVTNDLYQINCDNDKVLEELDLENLNPIGNEGLYEINPQPDTELGNLIGTITRIGITKGQKITNCFLHKIEPPSSALNLFKNKPNSNFIYFIQGKYNSGEVILDLSSIGGPTSKLLDTTQNILSILPGWVPYRIGKNISEQPLFALVGTLD